MKLFWGRRKKEEKEKTKVSSGSVEERMEGRKRKRTKEKLCCERKKNGRGEMRLLLEAKKEWNKERKKEKRSEIVLWEEEGNRGELR